MGIIQKGKDFFFNAVQANSSLPRLTVSFCMGVYIAFSPFFGAHTIMVFASSWLFRLNLPMVFFVSAAVNNPWTAIPVYAGGYSFGYWFIHSFLGLSPSLALSLDKFFGAGKICVWSLLIGGNILGIVFAIISYPLALRMFRLFLSKKIE